MGLSVVGLFMAFQTLRLTDMGIAQDSTFRIFGFLEHFGLVESLGFLSVPGLYKAIGEPMRNNMIPQFADHCFTGEYPTPLVDYQQDQADKERQLSLLDDV